MGSQAKNMGSMGDFWKQVGNKYSRLVWPSFIHFSAADYKLRRSNAYSTDCSHIYFTTHGKVLAI